MKWRTAWAVGLVALAALGLVAFLRSKPDADAVWRAAQEAQRAGRYDEAARGADRLARLRSPTDADWMLRAQVAMTRERVDDAIALLGRVDPASPLAPQASMASGMLELRRKRFRYAEGYFRRALEGDPNLSKPRRELIYLYGYQSRRAELSEQFERLAEREALGFDEVRLWCMARGIRWKPEEIVETLAEAVAADPLDRASRLALAEGLIELHRIDEANAALSAYAEDDPDTRAVRAGLAWEQGDTEEVRRLVGTGEPGDGHARAGTLALLRGKLALRDRDPAKAAEWFRRAADREPLDREALSGLSQALHQLGRGDEAAEATAKLDALTRLADLLEGFDDASAPPSTAQLVALGAACESLGQRPQAKAWYQLAIAADPLDRAAQAALAALGDG